MKTLTNGVRLIGHLGSDIELKTFESGRKKARVSIATNENYKSSTGELVEKTSWHNLEAWGKSAELMNDLLSKGSKVAIEGKLDYHRYTNKEGLDKQITIIKVNQFRKLDPKSADQASGSKNSESKYVNEEEDLPF